MKKQAELLWKELLSNSGEQKHSLLDDVKRLVETSTEPAVVSFGTSGWRGELGGEFTLRNVQVVAEAIVQMYRDADSSLLQELGVANFDEFAKRGLLLGHDNRMMGSRFAEVVGAVFLRHGVKVYYAGEASTPEYSAGIEMLGAACAINLTPSHNPANYAGFKFNPIDGGPAGPEITDEITRLANLQMEDHLYRDDGTPQMERVDLPLLYKSFLEKRGTLDLELIRSFAASGEVAIAIDYVHGSTRGRPRTLLGNDAKLISLRTEENLLFGGVAPEPSAKNMEGVVQELQKRDEPFRIGVIFDPDGDRIRFADHKIQIAMDQFGAMALHYLYTHRGIRGVLAKSVATSDFGNAIAHKLGIEIAETSVGFKNFRPYLRPGANPMAIVAYEESDGISGFNNTLEKDAQFGLLLAIEMVARLKMNLSDYLLQLQEEYGYFYSERYGFEVEKALVGPPLAAKVKALGEKLRVGETVEVDGAQKRIAQLITLDGVKVIFDDHSWMLVRPSGTEPKVRIYVECRREEEREAMFAAAQQLFYNS